jgi:hypothetical protein
MGRDPHCVSANDRLMDWSRNAKLVLAHRDGGPTDGPLTKAVWIASDDDPTQVSAIQVAMRCNLENSAPYLVYHPIDGEFIQMVSLHRKASALKEAKDYVQVLVVSQDANPFTEFPCPNLLHVVASLDSLSVPRLWPSGPPTKYSVRGTHSEAGNYGANQVMNSNGLGAIDIRRLTTV